MSWVVIFDNEPPRMRGRVAAPPPPLWPAKDPADVVVVSADFRLLLPCGATVATATAAVSPAGALSLGQITCDGTVVSLVAQGGTTGQPATVAITATTVSGEVFRRAAVLPVLSVAPAGSAPTPAGLADIITSGATPTVIGTLPIVSPAGAAVTMRGTVTARNVTTNLATAWDVAALVEEINTSSPAVTQSVTSFGGDPSMAGCALSVAASGASVTLIGTGLANTSIAWSVSLSVVVA